ncbi:MAG: OsmC family protein [Microscillaceae bacterium]
MGNAKFSFLGQSESPARLQGKIRHFSVLIDEPLELGGTDLAPNPVEYILAGYAGCLNVVGHLIAQEQGLVLKGLEIAIEGHLNTDKLFGVSDQERAGYQSLLVRLSPETDASPEALEKWLHTVESRCPVNDNLLNPTPIKVVLAPRLVAEAV